MLTRIDLRDTDPDARDLAAILPRADLDVAAALAAVRLAPAVQEYLLPSHCSAERVGSLLLEALDKKPLITAGLCLGEGTGGVLGAALLDYALAAYEQVVGIDEI